MTRLAGCLLAAWMVAPGQDEIDWAKRLAEAKFTLREAMVKALKESGEGVVFHAELEWDKGALVYSIDVAQGAKTCNVVLDIRDGKVLENDVEDEDNSGMIKACKVALDAAIDTALKKSAGSAIEAQLTLKDGKPLITVQVFGEGKLTVVKIDGASGEVLSAEAPKPKVQEKFTDTFSMEQGDFSSTGTNPYFILKPGYVLVLEGKDEGEDVRLTITVLDETKKVTGIETRIVEEREEADGKLKEVSRNFFAISKRTNGVYYFGEDVDMYKDGKVVSHDGAWVAGEKGARFGLMMAGTPLLGARYYQEVAPGVAMDRAVVVSLAETLETPAGKFENVLKIEESTPLEKGLEYKYYVAGIGLIKDGPLKLVKHGKAGK